MSFGSRPDPTQGGGVSEKLLQQAKASGQLNLSNRQLLSVPAEVRRGVYPEAAESCLLFSRYFLFR